MASNTIETRDLHNLFKDTGNVYKSVVVIAKRAKQVSTNQKEELNNKLADFATSVDNLEEIFENREQIEISKFYERMPKPSLVATEEFINNEIIYKSKNQAEIDESERA